MHNPRHQAIIYLSLCCVVVWLSLTTMRTTALLAQSSSALIPIYQLQGAGLVSPYAKQWVDTYGLVTGILPDGFYLQDPFGDGDPATSDGIFVYTQKPPTVSQGQCIALTRAYVDEFYEKTELSRLKAISQSDRCPTNTISPTPIGLARLGETPTARFEAYEGMVVQVTDLTGIVQGPTKHFATGERELALLPAALQPYLAGPRIFQADSAAMNGLMYLTNGLGASLPEVAWGATVQIGTATAAGYKATAILDYNFGKYQLHLLPDTQLQPMPTAARHTRQPETGTPTAADEFSLCTLNLYGLGRGSAQWPDEHAYIQQLAKRARAVAETLHGCTIIGIQETGTPADAQALADLLNSTYGFDYVATALAGPGTQSSEFPLTNSLLTRRAQVQVRHATLAQGCSARNYDVPVIPGDCPDGGYALFDRPPLVVDLLVTGAWSEPLALTVLVNHWKSKGGDETVNAVRRVAQAQHVATVVQQKLTSAPTAHIAVLGDLNDYYHSEPVERLRMGVQPPLIHLYDYLPMNDRYTYIFNGASQVLDHILVTPNLARMVALVDPVHTNADFPGSGQTQVQTLTHASDHDPVQVLLRPDGAAILGGSLRYANIHVQLLDERGVVVSESSTDENGDFRLWHVPTGTYTVTFTTPAVVSIAPTQLSIVMDGGYQVLPPPAVTHRTVKIGVALALTAGELFQTDQRQ